MKRKIIIMIVFIIMMYSGLYLYTDYVYSEGYEAGISAQLYNFKARNQGVPCKFL